MQIAAILSQKGGGGKTTVATNLAVAASRAGVPTLLLDMDPQQSALSWASWRMQNNSEAKAKNKTDAKAPLHVWEAGRKTIVQKIEAARAHKVKLIIIDTPPASAPESELAAKAADLVMVVVQPSYLDIATLPQTYSLPAVAARPAPVLLNRVRPTGDTQAEITAAIDRLGYTLAPCTITDREIYARVMIDGMGVQEGEKATGAASKEVAVLYRWVMTTLAKNSRKSAKAAAEAEDMMSIAGGKR